MYLAVCTAPGWFRDFMLSRLDYGLIVLHNFEPEASVTFEFLSHVPLDILAYVEIVYKELLQFTMSR